MSSKTFDKKPLGHRDLIQLLLNRGMVIDDQSITYSALERIGYYRLSGYCLTFLDKKTNKYNQSTSFQNVLDLYSFDTELRALISKCLEKLEVSLRCSICEQMSFLHGSHWYTLPEAFQAGKGISVLEEAAKKLDFDLNQNRPYKQQADAAKVKSRPIFLDHYYANYNDPLMPPAWMLREVATFGFWARVYEALNTSDQKRITQRWRHPDKKLIDHELLASWLWSLSILRNRCSHHTRITNLNFSFPPKLPINQSSKLFFYDKTDDLHTLISIILVLLNAATPDYDFRGELLSLFNRFPSVNIQKATGFSLEGKPDWSETNFWTLPLSP